MASPSPGVRVVRLPDPNVTPALEAAPGLKFRTLAPIVEIDFRIAEEEPAPISIMAITDPTPMMMPRAVNMARIGFRPNAVIALRTVR
jgi:hypothetical protein